MLYDTRWEKGPGKKPPRRYEWLFFFLSAFVPIFVGAYALADAYDDVAYLIWPLGANLALVLVSWVIGR